MAGTGLRAARLEHFAARWKHLASHKCGENKEIEHDPEKWVPVFGKDHA
jgi:hypothetical protein